MERIQSEQNSSNLGRNRKQLPPITLDLRRAVRYATRGLELNKKFALSASRFSNVKQVVYEDMLADPRKVIREVLEFLDVDPEQELNGKLLKATPNLLSKAVQNYEALCAAVQGTQLEAFLD